MDYFINTCDWTVLLMDSSHCHGDVAPPPPRAPPFISVESKSPIKLLHLPAVAAAPPTFVQGGKGQQRLGLTSVLSLGKVGVNGR